MVTIHAIDCLSFGDDSLTLRTACSKGTYIRVLAADIGQALGCGAHLAGLRRTRVGELDLGPAVTLAQLETLDEAGRAGCLQPVDDLLRTLPAAMLEGEAAERFRHGNPVELPAGLSGKIRVYVDRRLIGVGESATDGRLWPKKLVQLML